MRTVMLVSAVLLPLAATSVANEDSVTSGLAERMTREALAAGAAGDMDLREQLLAQVLRVAPDHAPAHWACGEMQVDGEWKPIVAIQDEASQNRQIDEYLRLRQRAATPNDQFQLAEWCELNDLNDEARYHWLQVLAADRDNRQALRALDLQRVGNNLLPTDRADQFLAEQRKLNKVNAKWRTRMAGWQRALAAGGDEAARALAEVEAVVDESAITEFEKLATRNEEQSTKRSVRLSKAYVSALGRLPSYEASLAITRVAVLAHDPALRELATGTLEARPTYEVVPVLLTGLTPLIESRFDIARSENGRVNYHHQFEAEGAETDFVAESSTTFNSPVVPQSQFTLDALYRATLIAERRSNAAAQQFYATAMRLEQMASEANTSREQFNERIISVLRSVTGEDFGNNPSLWWDFWREHNCYDETREVVAYRTSQTYYAPVVVELPPDFLPRIPNGYASSCFAAGTLVWTKTGRHPIESLTAGDLVLTMDERTGERCFRPVLVTTLRQPSPLVRIATGSFELLATPGHPFWVEGTGWQMAKELEAGDRVLSAQGAPIEIQAISSSGVEEEAFNLIVEDNSNYFVGPDGLLSHDNTPRKPELARAGQW